MSNMSGSYTEARVNACMVQYPVTHHWSVITQEGYDFVAGKQQRTGMETEVFIMTHRHFLPEMLLHTLQL